MENVTNHQVSVFFGEALEKNLVYAKFIKDLLIRKRKLNYVKNITLTEECSEITQRKLPPNLKDP